MHEAGPGEYDLSLQERVRADSAIGLECWKGGEESWLGREPKPRELQKREGRELQKGEEREGPKATLEKEETAKEGEGRKEGMDKAKEETEGEKEEGRKAALEGKWTGTEDLDNTVILRHNSFGSQ